MINEPLVITATTGNKKLIDCIKSVKTQSIKTNHLLVVDGFENRERVNDIITGVESTNLSVCYLPFNTGKNGFYAHKIMAGFAHLHPYKYLLFCDEDNWFERSHVESLVNLIVDQNLDFSFSYRNIYDEAGNFICKDECESLGDDSKIDNPAGKYLVDTSSYCFNSEFFVKVSHLWNHGWGADRRFFELMKFKLKANYSASKQFTLNYRLGGNPNSVKADFFVNGNKL